MKLLNQIAVVFLCANGAADAQLVLDPGNGTYRRFTSNSNSLYEQGRGALFTANTDFTLSSVGLTSLLSPGTVVTYEVLEVTNTFGDLLAGSTLLAQREFHTTTSGQVDHQASINPVSILAGHHYLIRASFDELELENWFYLFDPDVRPDVPVNLGDITLLDGTQNYNTANFLLPRFSINVPSSSTCALLSLAGLVAVRRRR